MNSPPPSSYYYYYYYYYYSYYYNHHSLLLLTNSHIENQVELLVKRCRIRTSRPGVECPQLIEPPFVPEGLVGEIHCQHFVLLVVDVGEEARLIEGRWRG